MALLDDVSVSVCEDGEGVCHFHSAVVCYAPTVVTELSRDLVSCIVVARCCGPGLKMKIDKRVLSKGYYNCLYKLCIVVVTGQMA